MQKLNEAILYCAQLGAFFILGAFIINAKKYPFCDEWIYVKALDASSREFWLWVVEQHGDHTIPIQKIIQYNLAKFSGYDFRILMFFNLLIAFLASQALLAAAKRYRGRQHYGDVIIPMILMLPTAAFAIWAFELQFLSSTFFVSLAIYFSIKYTSTHQYHYLNLTLLQLFLCAFCGLNGAIFSTIMGGGALAYFFYRPQPETQGKNSHLLIATLVVVTNISVWALWKPSPYSDLSTDFTTIAEYSIKLLPTSMAVSTLHDIYWESAAIMGGVGLAAYGIYAKSKLERISFADAILMLGIAASLALIAATALARSKMQGNWNIDIIMHYGYLTAFLPIIAWLLISQRHSPVASNLVGIVGIAMFANAYQENYITRLAWEQNLADKRHATTTALRESADIPTLVNKYISELYCKDDLVSRQLVSNGIAALRTHKYPAYTLNTLHTTSIENDNFTIEFLAKENCNGAVDGINNIKMATWSDSSPVQVPASTLLEISGWFVPHPIKVDPATTLYVVLTDANGKRMYLKTHSTSRPDIATSFKNKNLLQSGYTTLSDISSLEGQYSISLALQESNTIKICSQFKTPITVTK